MIIRVIVLYQVVNRVNIITRCNGSCSQNNNKKENIFEIKRERMHLSQHLLLYGLPVVNIDFQTL